MNTEVTPEQISRYQEDGFIVLENFLEANELENWRRCT